MGAAPPHPPHLRRRGGKKSQTAAPYPYRGFKSSSGWRSIKALASPAKPEELLNPQGYAHYTYAARGTLFETPELTVFFFWPQNSVFRPWAIPCGAFWKASPSTFFALGLSTRNKKVFALRVPATKIKGMEPPRRRCVHSTQWQRRRKQGCGGCSPPLVFASQTR